MSGKKAVGTLRPVEAAPAVISATEGEARQPVQTIRMDPETLKKLQYAAIDRGTTQQAIMLSALRRELGME